MSVYRLDNPGACGVLVKLTEGEMKPCLCHVGHVGGHNPFSPNPYMVPTLPDKVLVGIPIVTPQERTGVVWTDKSTAKRCLWIGQHARCVYELGHTLAHKEDLHT
jgi:hypothetical protein